MNNYNKNKYKTKCNFCRYWSGSSCMTVPNSKYCKEALDEYYQYLNKNKPQTPIRSKRPWDKK